MTGTTATFTLSAGVSAQDTRWSPHQVWTGTGTRTDGRVGGATGTHAVLLSVCETGSSPVSSPSQGVCPTPGCRGVGHIKGARYTGHHRWGPSHLSRCGCCWTGSSQGSRLSRLSRSAFGCPYSDINMRKEVVLPDRLGGERTITLVPVSVCSHGNQPDR